MNNPNATPTISFEDWWNDADNPSNQMLERDLSPEPTATATVSQAVGYAAIAQA